MMFLRRSLIALAAAACLVRDITAANLTVPELMQCEPATFTIEARGNVTIEARDADRMLTVMRAFVPVMGSRNWTWYSVDLPVNETAIILITDFFGSSPFDIAQHITTAVVGPSPTNNTACLPARYTKQTDDPDADSHSANSLEVPVIVGVLGGFLCLLLALVIMVMLRRRRERLAARKGGAATDASGEWNQDENRRLVPPDYTPAGGGYMTKLVPGLQISSPIEAEPSAIPGTRPRPGRRLGLRTWRRASSSDADAELPSYGESQQLSRTISPGYQGSRGQAFELRERFAPIRLNDAPSLSEAEGEGDDLADGWGGRTSMLGSIPISEIAAAGYSDRRVQDEAIRGRSRDQAASSRDDIDSMDHDLPPNSPLLAHPPSTRPAL